MKHFIISVFSLLFLTSVTASGQKFPTFLAGTWKLEKKETYEHWDLVQPNRLKGFLYHLNEGKPEVEEYLELREKEGEIVYTATVLTQNDGKETDFKLVAADSIYSFENPEHDFPKFIRYQMVSENKMKVNIGSENKSYQLFFDRVK
jgi:hypothetical protein